MASVLARLSATRSSLVFLRRRSVGSRAMARRMRTRAQAPRRRSARRPRRGRSRARRICGPRSSARASISATPPGRGVGRQDRRQGARSAQGGADGAPRPQAAVRPCRPHARGDPDVGDRGTRTGARRRPAPPGAGGGGRRSGGWAGARTSRPAPVSLGDGERYAVRGRWLSDGVSRSPRRSRRSAPGRPVWTCGARSVSALNSAPRRIAMFVTHSHMRKTTTPPSVP